MPNRWYLVGMSPTHTETASPEENRTAPREDGDRDQIVERLSWTPKQRLAYLTDMIAFEERVRRARQLG